MRGLLGCLLGLLVVLAPAQAQQRHATVLLDDGQRVEGQVLAMNLDELEVRVGEEVLKIPAARIRSCRFASSDGNVTEEPQDDDGAGVEAAAPGAQGPSGGSATGTGAPARRVPWQGPLPDPVDPEGAAQPPHDLRRSLLRSRLQTLDECYPWLVPAAPAQWLSIGLLLFIGLGLSVHASVNVAGADAASLGRSLGLGTWYLLTTLLQMAMVPLNDFTVVLMLLANPALALFWLCGLFGLPRSGAMIAFAVQLGFGAVAYGVLELVTALLASCGVAT